MMMMMMMMKIRNTQQSNRCGGGTTKMMDYFYYYYYWECIGDVFSLCQVMMRMTQQITKYYATALDGLMRTHTTTNQKQAAIMEDSKERWHFHDMTTTRIR